MAKIERTYTIPLRKEWLKAPRYRRAKKAVTAIKEFLIKHMKSEDVRLGKHLNAELWKHGIKNPPGRIKVNVLKDEKGTVRAEIFGKKIDAGEKKEKKEEKGIAEKMKETITGKKEEKKAPVKKKKKEETAAEEKKEAGVKKAKEEAKETEKKPKQAEKKKEEPAKEENKEEAKPAEESKKEPEKKESEKPAEKKKEEAKEEKKALKAEPKPAEK